MQQKIAVFALAFSAPMWASAVFDEGHLTFGEVKKISAKLKDQETKVKPAVVKLMSSGFKVLVDEVSPIVTAGTGASLIKLSSKHRDERPVLVAGLERYRELKRLGAIIFPQKSGERFNIPEDVVESEFNASGDEVYRINWPVLTADHVVTILACYATIYHPVASAAYIAGMNADTPEKKPTSGVVAAFNRILNARHINDVNPSPEPLTGRVIDENTRIL
ncbi:maturation control protein [Rosenbergiella epipactidis]|uniref:maturation control protein n=1 Tax=Rosenbergiella epipactidis TaxID=1544694 RepID=UPI001F4F0F70|nr:maturation control protein [Rosenbergiella epipactidis]